MQYASCVLYSRKQKLVSRRHAPPPPHPINNNNNNNERSRGSKKAIEVTIKKPFR